MHLKNSLKVTLDWQVPDVGWRTQGLKQGDDKTENDCPSVNIM